MKLWKIKINERIKPKSKHNALQSVELSLHILYVVLCEILFQAALQDLHVNNKISGLLPYLVNFVSCGVKMVSHDLVQLTRLLDIIDALTANPVMYLGPYVSIIIFSHVSSLPTTVHDTWKWTVPRECHSRQILQEMLGVEHLACKPQVEYSYASGTKYHQQSSKGLANFVRQIVDREMTVPPFLSDSREVLTFFVQFHCVMYCKCLNVVLKLCIGYWKEEVMMVSDMRICWCSVTKRQTECCYSIMYNPQLCFSYHSPYLLLVKINLEYTLSFFKRSYLDLFLKVCSYFTAMQLLYNPMRTTCRLVKMRIWSYIEPITECVKKIVSYESFWCTVITLVSNWLNKWPYHDVNQSYMLLVGQ